MNIPRWFFAFFGITKALPKPRRKIVEIAVKQAIDQSGAVESGTALFTHGAPETTTAKVPIDALGELAMNHPDRLYMDFIDLSASDLPAKERARAGRLYLGVEKVEGGWTAVFGGLNLFPPVCRCPCSNMTWYKTKVWENKYRALGILLIEHQLTTCVHIYYDSHNPIRLRHPDDKPDPNGDTGHCCCSST